MLSTSVSDSDVRYPPSQSTMTNGAITAIVSEKPVQ
jgi:hypothetical protein